MTAIEAVTVPEEQRFADCLCSLFRLKLNDQFGGRLRLGLACQRCVEHDLSDEEAVECIFAYCKFRPFPGGVSDDEIISRLRAAENGCRRGAAYAEQADAAPPVVLPQYLTVEELMASYPGMREPLIEGLLREGETINVIATQKTGKSWLVTDLAIAVATGRPWLGRFPTRRGNVLILDNELHGETIADRIPKVALARGIDPAEFREHVCVENLRGRLVDLIRLQTYFRAIQPGLFKVVILDAFYRFVPPDTDENDNGTMARLYNYIDSYALGRRTNVDHTGVAFGSPTPPIAQPFGYNDRNELTTSSRGAASWGYLYDAIGNRKTYTTAGPITTTYASNALNQYDRWDRPGGSGVLARQRYTYDADGNLAQTWIAGDMNCDGVVSSPDVNAFTLAISNPAAYQQQYPNCNILNGDINGDGLVDFGDVNPFVSLLSTGNAAVDQTFVWDAENRLVRVEPTTPINGDKKVEFKYDYLGRRVLKRVLVWDPALNGGNGGWSDSAGLGAYTRRFVWSGWLMLLELQGETGFQPVRKYTWGLDLAGMSAGPSRDRQGAGLEGAGGIGGLLAMQAPGAGPAGGDLNAVYTYDANGNVGQLVAWAPELTTPPGEWSAGRLLAHYEYDPYGGVTAQSGTYAAANPMRFSTKYWDDETGLGYWGYRYYSPALGRWINRDPIGERGGPHMYAYVRNSPTAYYDRDGRYYAAAQQSGSGACERCCCVEALVYTDESLIGNEIEIGPYGHRFTVIAKLRCRGVRKGQGGDPKFEWWEWSDRQNTDPAHQFQVLKVWNNMSGGHSPTFKNWPGKPGYNPPCEGKHDVRMTDEPVVGSPLFKGNIDRSLYIWIRGSSPPCCGSGWRIIRIYQRLTMRGGIGVSRFIDHGYTLPKYGKPFPLYEGEPVGEPPVWDPPW